MSKLAYFQEELKPFEKSGVTINPIKYKDGYLLPVEYCDYLENFSVIDLDVENRKDIVETSIEAANASDIDIPVEEFYFSIRDAVNDYIATGSDSLKIVFEQSDHKWLDMEQDGQTPREYMIELLEVEL
jgi:hypothetical protein